MAAARQGLLRGLVETPGTPAQRPVSASAEAVLAH